MKTIFDWLVRSSVNPGATSLTIRGALLSIVPLIIYVSGLSGLVTSEDQVISIIGAVAELVEQTLIVVSALMSVYGLSRKIGITVGNKFN